MIFLRYIFNPAMLLASACLQVHLCHYWLAAFYFAYLPILIWSSPWFAVLVVKSLLGIA